MNLTQDKLFKMVVYIAGASLLLPLLVSAAGGSDGVNTKLARYLQLSAVTAKATPQVGGTDAEINVPASNLPGQPVKGVKVTPGTPETLSKPAEPAAPTTPTPSTTNNLTPSPAAKTNTAGDKAAGEYVVKDGDTYGCIAEKYYGSYGQYQTVMDANFADSAPGYGEYHLDVGAKVILPAVSGANMTPATSLCKQLKPYTLNFGLIVLTVPQH